MFEPIQRYLPQYFNSDPEKREAIRLRAPAGTTAPWEIRDERLTIAWADQSRVFELHDHTVGSLVDALQAEGFVLDPGYDHLLLALGGVVLLEGRITITPDGGTPVTVKAGDAFVVEPTFKGTWRIEENVRKHFDFRLK